MKTLRTLLLGIVIVGSFSYSGYEYIKGPCGDPLTYKIGQFNEKFGISQSDFMSALAEAEAIWEKPAGKNLFEYSVTAKMPIHLIYDERQATMVQNKKLEAKIDQANGSADIIKNNLESTKVSYARVKSEYESLLSQFKVSQDSYVSRIEYWNKRGGAPAAEYAQLAADKKVLDGVYAELEAKRVEVNTLATRLNGLVGSYNGVIENINSNVAVINQSADKEFEQGEYISDASGRRINIYEFTEREALVRVLAHELGHALGIDHNNNPDSIMYYLNQGKEMTASADDLAGMNAVCRFTKKV